MNLSVKQNLTYFILLLLFIFKKHTQCKSSIIDQQVSMLTDKFNLQTHVNNLSCTISLKFNISVNGHITQSVSHQRFLFNNHVHLQMKISTP